MKPEAFEKVVGDVSVVRVAKGPTVDGRADDETWKSAKRAVIKVDMPARSLRPEKQVSFAAVHDGTRIYVLFEWEDSAKSEEYKPWIWNETEGQYEEELSLDDAAFIAFPLEGRFNANMRVGVEAKWDVWEWMAGRTDPAGHAMDLVHVFTHEKPAGMAKDPLEGYDGKEFWILRREDEGESVLVRHEAPKRKGRDRVPQYEPWKPSGSAADVLAKGMWKEGSWTVEFSRLLDTGHPDDVRLEPGREILFAVGYLDEAKMAQHCTSLPHRMKLEK